MAEVVKSNDLSSPASQEYIREKLQEHQSKILVGLGESEEDENLPKVASKAKLDRKLAAAAQHVQNPNTNLTA